MTVDSISPAHMDNLKRSGLSYQEIAEAYGYTESGVRGMLSRFRNKLRSENPSIIDTGDVSIPASPSEERVQRVIDTGQDIVKRFLNRNETYRFLFTSDHHWPYQNDDAISLNLKIIEEFQPDLITGLNDFFDFADYTHWEDMRTPSAKLWGSDLQRPLDIHKRWMAEVQNRLRKPALHLGIWGNHDVWLYEYLLRNTGGVASYTLANVIEELAKDGLVLNSWPNRNHVVKLSPRLKILHGTVASKNPSTVAKNTLEQVAGKAYELDAGQYYNVVYGHDHRSTEYHWNGVGAYGAGCNCQVDMPYLNAAPNWQHGVVVGHFNPKTIEFEATCIQFSPAGSHLYCYLNGQKITS